MNKTRIEWCDSTVNPVIGCTFGCPYCYARKMNQRFGWVEDFTKPQYFPKRLNQLRSKKPKVIFMNSMSDIADWTPEQTNAVFAACEANPQHKYLFLTKRSEHFRFLANAEILPGKDNFWFGTTLTGVDGESLRMSGKNCFLSIEPILAPFKAINMWQYFGWVIIGAETGNRKGKVVPKKEWIDDIVQKCQKTSVPIFMKDSLIPIVGEENMIREFPWESEGEG